MTPEYLLDTNILSDMIRRPDGHAAQRARGRACATSIFVSGELRFGAERRNDHRLFERVEHILRLVPPSPFEAPGDQFYARIRTGLERAGTPIGHNDLWIAAHALALGCTLVTANEREFRRVPGLRVENWLTPADI